eukprot:1190575-Prorocentrum_minimum.AAC.2
MDQSDAGSTGIFSRRQPPPKVTPPQSNTPTRSQSGPRSLPHRPWGPSAPSPEGVWEQDVDLPARLSRLSDRLRGVPASEGVPARLAVRNWSWVCRTAACDTDRTGIFPLAHQCEEPD